MTNGGTSKQSLLAVASLTSALLVFFPPAWVAALVLGVVALVEIKQSGGALRGRGLAIGGIVLSIVWTVALTLLLINALSTARKDALESAPSGPDQYQQDTAADLDEDTAPDATAAPTATKSNAGPTAAQGTTPSPSSQTPPKKQ